MKRQSAAALLVTLFTTICVAAVLSAAPPKPSRTTFSSSARQLTDGDKVTVKAIVTAISAPDGVPTGSIEFVDGATSLGSVTLAAGDGGMQGSLELTLGVGPHPITVKYSGDPIFGGSVSQPEFIVVLARP
jgi:hypothetical protein